MRLPDLEASLGVNARIKAVKPRARWRYTPNASWLAPARRRRAAWFEAAH